MSGFFCKGVVAMFRKGSRVRLWYRYLLQVVRFILFLPFLLLSGWAFYHDVFLPDMMRIVLAYAPVVFFLVLGFVVVWFLQSDFSPLRFWFRRLRHKQMLAAYLFEEGFYLTRRDGDGKSRIVSYPKVYTKYRQAYIEVRFALDMQKWQSAFTSLAATLEAALYADLFEQLYEENYIVYVLLYAPEKNRVNVEDLRPTQTKIQLMKHITWDFVQMPHALIQGGTGSGKTLFLLSLVYSFLKLHAKVTIVDPKKLDLSYLEYVPSLEDRVFYARGGIERAVREFHDEMEERAEEMRRLSNGQSGLNYADLGLQPHFLIFDEYVAFLSIYTRSQKDFQAKDELLRLLKRVLLLGRQAGFFLICTMQRADAEYFPDGMRDQFGLRVALGANSSQGYRMVFGDIDKNLVLKTGKGRGYVMLGTNDVKEFYAPFVSKNFDFTKEIAALFGEVPASQAAIEPQPAGVDDAHELQL